ncbi:hypothetical protein [Arthrobacter mobilis]|uniref:Uncharacterized protein n=1 Tax=Arthrobacter mobilis TaxID=2724944 RepID=A0A7X6HFB1_9MICC|nr:hypothetical protein [Arthrobacter mobilis]NKX55966.1 hypothetical protein [Arthrobacter mobilis]
MSLDRELLRMADDMDNAIAGTPEFIGPGGIRFNASEQLRSLVARYGTGTPSAQKAPDAPPF